MDSFEQDMGRDFTINLHGYLKCAVRGNVFCRVVDDELIVHINRKDVTFSYKKENIIEAIASGLDAEKLSRDILSEYKKVLNIVFFVNGGK